MLRSVYFVWIVFAAVHTLHLDFLPRRYRKIYEDHIKELASHISALAVNSKESNLAGSNTPKAYDREMIQNTNWQRLLQEIEQHQAKTTATPKPNRRQNVRRNEGVVWYNRIS